MRIDDMLNELEAPSHAIWGMRPLPQLEEARKRWAQVRGEHGLKPDGTVPLLQSEGNTKIDKNNVPTLSLTLSPAVTSGHNVCERSTPQCRKACVLWTAGRGVFPSVRQARKAKTDFLAKYAYSFLRLLYNDLQNAERRYQGQVWAVRLNVASDIRWERFPWLFDFQGMHAYDYTKWAVKDRPKLPSNYRLTYSASEHTTISYIATLLDQGKNVAMVFDCPKHQLPARWRPHPGSFSTYPVIDGDVDDCRYWDPKGVIVGLAAKGAAKKLDVGGFVTAATPVSLSTRA